jgi:diguanylate cyclase (GGDEF)-like protein/PAS domain S-box-containing protein
MIASSQPLRVLFLESSSSLSAALVNAFHAKSLRSLFQLVSAHTLTEAFREIDHNPPDLVFVEVDPSDAPEFSTLKRLRAHAPQRPIVAILADGDRTSAPAALQNGAQACLIENQFGSETLPSFLFRVMERHSVQQAMHESNQRFRLMIENASDLIFIVDDAGLIDYASASAERLFQRPESYFTGKNALDMLHRDDRKRVFDYLEKAFGSERALPFIQFRVRGPENTWIHLEGKGRIALDFKGRRACVMNCRDVSHRVELEEELRNISLRDQLTGLPNRRAFVTCLEQPLKLAQRQKQNKLCLLFIDLDGFKGINDNFGHKEGDRVLIEAAKILKTTFRNADLVARLGGDEFVVFLTGDMAALHVDMLKRRLMDSVDEWNQTKKRPYLLAMSAGAVQYDSRKHKSVEQMLKHADELMYKHKRERKLLLGNPARSPQSKELTAN